MQDFDLDRRTVLKLAGATAVSGSALRMGTTTAEAADFAGPIEVEGPISSIVDDGDGTGTVNAMGMSLDVNAGTTLTSPTGKVLTITEAATGPLPNRTEQGFVGGTVKGAGEITHLDPPALTLTNAILEPAENVVFGAVTATSDPETIYINGVEIDPVDDPRMPFPGYTDAAGASITPSQIPIGTVAASEGYYASGALNVFVVELDFVLEGTNSVSIQRAEYRPDPSGRDELRVDGAASDPEGRVFIANVTGTNPLTVERITKIDSVPVDPVDNTWRVDVRTGNLDVNEQIVAQLEDSSGTQVAQSDPFTVTVDN